MRHVVILEGPPLCGKSYQAEGLEKKKFNYHRVECGDILRTYPGLTPIISKGDLVPDDEVIGAVEKSLPQPLPGRLVFSGFPRSIEQARWLANHLDGNRCRVGVIMFRVREQVLLSRLEIRKKKEKRNDDTPECYHHRLALYKRYGPGVRQFLCTNPSWETHWIDAESSREQVSREIEGFVASELLVLEKNKPFSLVQGFQET